MSNSIEFRGIDLSTAGWIQCEVVRDDSQEFWVELPYGFVPEQDLVAAFLVSLCGSHFDSIRLDLSIGEELRDSLAACANASIHCRSGVAVRRRPGVGSALNFSGGFDSLAARRFVPKAELISLDFGGRFSRERQFFSRFDPLTFRTNLVDIGLNRYSWQFMGMGSILMRDELRLGSYSFGSILAGSLPRLLEFPQRQGEMTVKAASAVGLVARNPVVGLSEIATMILAFRGFTGLMVSALASVALPGEDKYTRKRQMLGTVSRVEGTPLEIEAPSNVVARRSWGSSFATDLSSLYVLQNGSVSDVVESYIDGVPESVLQEVPNLDLSFMTRFNPHAYSAIEHDLRADWYSLMLREGFLPYERNDWESASRVVELLRRT